MRTRTFDWDVKEKGWKPRGADGFNAGGGLVATHDVIEHFTNDESFKNELIAFGATMFGRGVDESMPKVAAHDLSNFLMEQGMKVEKPNKRWSKPLKFEAEKTIGRLLTATRIRLALLGVNRKYFDGEIEEAMSNSRDWIRLGWRISERLFKGHSRVDVRNVFVDMMDAVNLNHDEFMPVKGDTLTINFDRKTLWYELQRGHRSKS